ncbi:hypothetical protein PT276_06865 [Orbaceae bacterium ESL0721]|nr:hypothetical protein [Orbaceae bacterium ESL0721]
MARIKYANGLLATIMIPIATQTAIIMTGICSTTPTAVIQSI